MFAIEKSEKEKNGTERQSDDELHVFERGGKEGTLLVYLQGNVGLKKGGECTRTKEREWAKRKSKKNGTKKKRMSEWWMRDGEKCFTHGPRLRPREPGP